MKRRLMSIASALLLAACQPFVATPVGRVQVGDGMTVETKRIWSKANLNAPAELWTQDGLALNTVGFTAALAKGRPIFKPIAAVAGAQTPPGFDPAMNPAEIAEFFESSLSRQLQDTPVQVKNQRPAAFGGYPGFRFDYEFVGKADDLLRAGTAAGAVVNGRLFMIFFHGAKQHYFGAHRDEVEAMIESVAVKG